VFLDQVKYWLKEEIGYIGIQVPSRKSGVWYSDSPAGLCGVDIEKFRAWSDSNGNLNNLSPRMSADQYNHLLVDRGDRSDSAVLLALHLRGQYPRILPARPVGYAEFPARSFATSLDRERVYDIVGGPDGEGAFRRLRAARR